MGCAQYLELIQCAQSARNLLLSVKLYNHSLNGSGLLKEVNLLQGEQDENHLVFAVDDVAQFPHEELRNLDLSISGVRAPAFGWMGYIGKFPELTVCDVETIKVEISNAASVIGSLENLSSTLEEVQDMIDCNRHTLYFSELGMFDAETRLPIPQRDHCLDGSTVLIKKIKIAEDAIQSALSLRHELPAEEVLGGEDDDLKNLSIANPNHKGLRLAVEEHRALEKRNRMLKISRDLVQSVEASYPGGCLRFKLGEGRLQNTLDGNAAWTFFESPREEASIPVSSISCIQIMLANMKLSGPMGPMFYTRQRWTENGTLFLKYSHDITAVFLPDESWNALVDNFPVIDYIDHKLMSGPNVTTNYAGPEPESELTMKLFWLQIGLGVIRNHLDVLGIDTTREGGE